MMSTSLHHCAVAGAAEEALFARVYPAPPRASRTPFQRDRERIVQARSMSIPVSKLEPTFR